MKCKNDHEFEFPAYKETLFDGPYARLGTIGGGHEVGLTRMIRGWIPVCPSCGEPIKEG